MRPALDLRRALLASLVAVGLAGCAVSDPTRYYMLASVGAHADASRPAASDPVTIGVGPVTIPGYLDRTQVVTRGTEGLEIWPYQRWAEPLDTGIAHALADDLAARVPTDRVVVFPWRGAMARVLDYQVVVSVMRFDGAPGQNVTLDTRWRILGKDGMEVAFRRSVLTEPVSGAGFSSLVGAMNRALGALGQEIAGEIQSQSAKRSATRD
jgi:uncharacterized lipoprotein YmbA